MDPNHPIHPALRPPTGDDTPVTDFAGNIIVPTPPQPTVPLDSRHPAFRPPTGDNTPVTDFAGNVIVPPPPQPKVEEFEFVNMIYRILRSLMRTKLGNADLDRVGYSNAYATNYDHLATNMLASFPWAKPALARLRKVREDFLVHDDINRERIELASAICEIANEVAYTDIPHLRHLVLKKMEGYETPIAVGAPAIEKLDAMVPKFMDVMRDATEWAEAQNGSTATTVKDGSDATPVKAPSPPPTVKSTYEEAKQGNMCKDLDKELPEVPKEEVKPVKKRESSLFSTEGTDGLRKMMRRMSMRSSRAPGTGED